MDQKKRILIDSYYLMFGNPGLLGSLQNLSNLAKKI